MLERFRLTRSVKTADNDPIALGTDTSSTLIIPTDLSIPTILKRTPEMIQDPGELLGGVAPPIQADDAEDEADDAVAVERGIAAWKARKADASWPDWKAIGKALMIGRKEAMAAAKTSKPAGKAYIQHFHYWLQTRGFDDIDKSDRVKLLSIVENLDRVEAWRENLSEAERLKYTHPSNLWRAWICPNRGNRGKPRASEQQIEEERDIAATTLEQRADEFDEEREEIAWQRGLPLRARKAIGDARLHGHWALDEPPDAGLVEVVRRAKEAWSGLYDYIVWAHKAPREELAEVRKNEKSSRQPKPCAVVWVNRSTTQQEDGTG